MLLLFIQPWWIWLVGLLFPLCRSICRLSRLDTDLFFKHGRLTRPDLFGTWDCVRGSVDLFYDQVLEHPFQVKEVSNLRVIFEHLTAFNVIRDRGPVSHLNLILIALVERNLECRRRSHLRIYDSILQSRDKGKLAQVETFDQVLNRIPIASHSGMSGLVLSL